MVDDEMVVPDTRKMIIPDTREIPYIKARLDQVEAKITESMNQLDSVVDNQKS